MDRRQRRLIAAVVVFVVAAGTIAYGQWSANRQSQAPPPGRPAVQAPAGQTLASAALGRLAVKANVSSEGYSRDQFGSGWATVAGCDTRNRILQRDLVQTVLSPDDSCTVLSGVLQDDPYTGKTIQFQRGENSSAVQIDHIVALSDAWQKGAQALSPQQRVDFANDPLNLLASDGPANMQKSDSDAAEWLPRQVYQCRYVARQIAVKLKYALWVNHLEQSAMSQVLGTCPAQVLPVETGS